MRVPLFGVFRMQPLLNNYLDTMGSRRHAYAAFTETSWLMANPRSVLRAVLR
jgi:hypothetical protein